MTSIDIYLAIQFCVTFADSHAPLSRELLDLLDQEGICPSETRFSSAMPSILPLGRSFSQASWPFFHPGMSNARRRHDASVVLGRQSVYDNKEKLFG